MNEYSSCLVQSGLLLRCWCAYELLILEAIGISLAMVRMMSGQISRFAGLLYQFLSTNTTCCLFGAGRSVVHEPAA